MTSTSTPAGAVMRRDLVRPKWSVHIDHPWSECVKLDGAPMRIYMWTPWAFVTIALTPGSKSQVYDGRWTDRWSWLTFHPRGD